MCWKCGQPLEATKPGFRDLCPACGKDLHACRNCRFYKPGAYRDCAETVPDGVTDKERSNFCEYFQPAAGPWGPKGGASGGKGAEAKREFDKLFGG